ncbi:malignant fibrous histiocytoma-amplified sequence 1 homolog [Lingula anatina]|uniref:Malignant fibrous histiocytoma-amplified sequence 1 homolog n=1 Tax=Lingula anatina TaxID=7574 RepID=A0A1S3IXR0_LINAN|nr:malignant fibrous histiocytoma-amplified sequence 1 homolog [Lingula anatina]|eukprot:XP_013402818.1 malignant fibrous histiocytoma-amplified sequence 1 homolog [Lingula anatina]
MLKTIPDAVGRLSNLTELNVSNNQLTAIPVFIVDNLTKLKIFDIRHNQITRLPSLQKLVQLKKFDFVKNPLQEPPLEVCELGVEAILQYQHDMKLYDRIGARYGRRQVVYVIGESEVGKSSFCESLRLRHAFVTESGDYTTVVNESFISDGSTVFNFWDFGGHDMYKVICPLLLRPNAVVILMFDLSKYACTTNAYYLNSIGFWIRKLQSRIPGVKVMIVGSKSDLLTEEEIKSRIQDVTEKVNHYQEQVYKTNIEHKLEGIESELKGKPIWKREERQKLEMKKESLENKLDSMLCISKKIFAISSLKYQGIPDIRKELQGIANENALLLPPNWVEFADEVMKHKTKAQTEGNSKPQSLHMSVGEAYRIWEQCNGYRATQCTWFQPIKDAFHTVSKFIKMHSKKKAFETQLDFLHKWGCILWHRQNSRLCDSVIHDTGRMIDFLKRVFDYNLFETLKGEKARGLYTCSKAQFSREMRLLKKGVLITRLMANILADFEENEQEFLFSLLQEFDLCYKVRFGKGTQGLYFPWYLFKQEEPEDLPHVWPSVLEDEQIQLQVEFHFLIVVPISYFEKLQGRLHCSVCSFEDSQRRDWCNGMFTRYGSSRILIRRVQEQNEAKIEVAVRGKIVEFEELWKILCWIHTEMQDLLTEYPGETSDVIYLCPACTKEGSKKPLKLPWDTVTTLPAFASFRHCIISNTVACHGQPNAPQIPAVFHYPMLSSKGCCKQLRDYEKICRKKCVQKDQVKKGSVRKKNSKRGKKATVVNLKEEHHHQHNETINISGSNGVHIGDTNITNVQPSQVTTS